MGAETKISKEFKDIFELGGVPAYNQFYNLGIFVWKYLYRGLYNPWHVIDAPTVGNPKTKRTMFRLNLPKAACAEMAGMIWSEECQVNVTRHGFEPSEATPTDPLGDFVLDVLQKNGFWTKMQEAIEQEQALGGEAIKVWFEPTKNAEGQPVAKINGGKPVVDSDGYKVTDGNIKIGYCMADQFVPTAWDNAQVTEGVFISRQAKDGYYWTRLEWHKRDGATYIVENELYRADAPKNTEAQDILGYRYPLAAMYPLLNERTEFTGLEKSLFSYFRTPIANNIDDNSPLGVSIYSNALDTLHALDICFDSFVREFRLGKKRIIVPARCVETLTGPNGEQIRYFNASDETYEALNTEDPDSLKIQDNSVELRVEEHVAAINAFLSILCLQLGFSASTFTFDLHSGLKTATEVVSENSKTYKTIKNNQTQIGTAIERLVENIIAVASLYGVEWGGVPVSTLAAGGYECSVVFDDSVIQDRQTNINEGVMLTSNGLMSKQSFMTKILGMTEEQAQAELAKVKDEGKVDTVALDRFNTFTED